MNKAAEPYDLLGGRAGGEGARKAVRVAERLGEALAVALRRAVPFLGRRGVPVRFESAAVVPAGMHDDTAAYVVPFDVQDRGKGSMTFDRNVAALLVDGLLGGDGKKAVPKLGDRLSRVQMAFMRSAGLQILTAMSDVAHKAHGSALRAAEESSDAAPREGVCIGITLEVGDDGKVFMLFPVTMFGAAEEVNAPRGPDPRVMATLFSAPVEVAVELGRTQLSMRKLMALQVGGMLVLDTAVDGRATLRVDGRVVAHGRPKTEAGHFAVRIEAVHGEPEEVGTTFSLSSLEASPPQP